MCAGKRCALGDRRIGFVWELWWGRNANAGEKFTIKLLWGVPVGTSGESPRARVLTKVVCS